MTDSITVRKPRFREKRMVDLTPGDILATPFGYRATIIGIKRVPNYGIVRFQRCDIGTWTLWAFHLADWNTESQYSDITYFGHSTTTTVLDGYDIVAAEVVE
jgi:hypothetical protein